jgi:hypothetical protein
MSEWIELNTNGLMWIGAFFIAIGAPLFVLGVLHECGVLK